MDNTQIEELIGKANIGVQHARKNNDEDKAERIIGHLRKVLGSVDYNWRTNPYAVEILEENNSSMNESKKAKELIALLEKITGKKVIVEYPETAEAPALSKRQLGAQQAIQTKGYEEGTEGQFALAYFIARYGKGKLPQPYNTMNMDQVADDVNMKKSTLAMTISRFKNSLGEEGLTAGGPKLSAAFEKFSNMKPEEVSALALSALTDTSKIGKDVNGHKHADVAPKKPTITRNDISPQELQALNAKRALSGQKPLKLRGGKLYSESMNREKSALIEGIIKTVTQTDEDSKLVEAIVAKSKGNTAFEIKLTEVVASKINDEKVLLSKYLAAKELNKESIAYVFYNEAKDVIKENMINEAIAKLNELTGSEVVLSESAEPINEAQLNEWFAKGAYNKLMRMLDKAVKQVDNMNGLAAMYPETWKGTEPDEVKGALKNIFTTLTKDGKHLKTAEKPSLGEAVELNEWFAKGAYNRLVRILNKCAKQAEKVNQYLAFYPEDFDVDTKAILARIKQIWKTFNKGEVSGGNVGFAADDVNKLSHKAPRGPKKLSAQDQVAASVHDREAQRLGGTAAGSVHQNVSNSIKPNASKPKSITAPEPAEDEPQALPDTKIEKKKEPLSKRIVDRVGKFFSEEEIAEGEQELNELFGYSKKEKEEKALRFQVEKAAAEAKNFSVSTLIGQPGGKTPEESDSNARTIIAARIRDAKANLPTVAQLMPQLFELKPNSTNAARVNYKGHSDCIIPSNWYFITNGTHEVNDKSKEHFIARISRELKELMKSAGIQN